MAVEDSASGVGSASNAGVGLIVGYVGATHIPTDNKESHAQMLLEGHGESLEVAHDCVVRGLVGVEVDEGGAREFFRAACSFRLVLVLCITDPSA